MFHKSYKGPVNYSLEMRKLWRCDGKIDPGVLADNDKMSESTVICFSVVKLMV